MTENQNLAARNIDLKEKIINLELENQKLLKNNQELVKNLKRENDENFSMSM